MVTPYLLREPRPGAGLRLFCFHHAGGAASAFTGFADRLGPGVDVLGVQLPGREGRSADPRPADMAALVDELLDALGDDLLRTPFALYGHSMGAIVAYAVARALVDRGAPLPELLAVGAHPAPDMPGLLTDAPSRSQQDMAHLLVRIGGMSAMLLDYPDWRDPAVDLVRADLRLCHSHRYEDRGPLPFPVHAFAGTADPLMKPADATAWERHSAGGFKLHRIPGGHFFVREQAPVFLAALRPVLAAAERCRFMSRIDQP